MRGPALPKVGQERAFGWGSKTSRRSQWDFRGRPGIGFGLGRRGGDVDNTHIYQWINELLSAIYVINSKNGGTMLLHGLCCSSTHACYFRGGVASEELLTSVTDESPAD
jgi:hypothetical protein